MENATSCVIELIALSKKRECAKISEMVLNKVQFLVQKVDAAVQDRDEEMAEQLSDIFVELGINHLEQIVSSQTLTIPQILIKLLSVPEIKAYKQVNFWRKLFKEIGKIPQIETKRQKLQAFEPILTELLGQIIRQLQCEDDKEFEEFNYCREDDEAFDELYRKRQDFGEVLDKIANACGASVILDFFL